MFPWMGEGPLPRDVELQQYHILAGHYDDDDHYCPTPSPPPGWDVYGEEHLRITGFWPGEELCHDDSMKD